MNLPDEIATPVRNLYRIIDFRQTELPLVHCTLDRDAIRRFEEVLCSPLFADYESAAMELDLSWVGVDAAIKRQQRAVRALVRANSSFLILKQSPLTIVASFIQVLAELCDGLPVKLAKTALALTQHVANKEERVVIYRMLPRPE